MVVTEPLWPSANFPALWMPAIHHVHGVSGRASWDCFRLAQCSRRKQQRLIPMVSTRGFKLDSSQTTRKKEGQKNKKQVAFYPLLWLRSLTQLQVPLSFFTRGGFGRHQRDSFQSSPKNLLRESCGRAVGAVLWFVRLVLGSSGAGEGWAVS